jgi:hypothetical protein
MPGQSPPTNVVAFTGGAADGTVGVVAGAELELATTTEGRPESDSCGWRLTVAMVTNAPAPAHNAIIFTARPRRRRDPIDLIEPPIRDDTERHLDKSTLVSADVARAPTQGFRTAIPSLVQGSAVKATASGRQRAEIRWC